MATFRTTSIISEIKGSVAGNNYKKNRQGLSISRKSSKKSNKSSRSSYAQQITQQLATLSSDLLPAIYERYLAVWDKGMSFRNFFIKFNYYNEFFGLIYSTSPQFPYSMPFVNSANIIYVVATGRFYWQSSINNITAVRIAVRVSRLTSNGITMNVKYLQLSFYLQPSGSMNVDVTDRILATTGILPNQWYLRGKICVEAFFWQTNSILKSDIFLKNIDIV